MSLFNNSQMMGASGAGAYEIERSLRFNNDDTPKLSRSWSGDDGNLKTQTYSFWFKRKKRGSQGYFLTCWNGSNTDRIGITSDDQLHIEFKDGGSTEAEWHSESEFRDESSWYHAVVAIDTTQSTETNRLKVWINGVAITYWNTYNAVDQDYQLDGFGRANKTHVMGAYAGGTTSTNSHFDGYITEFHYLDGVAKTASDFGETDSVTGQWIPKKYAGSYGSKGWYLNFSDNSNTTDTTLGKDSSGNGNNWTPANLSVSSGGGNDSFIDTPTDNFMNMMSDGRLNITVSEGGQKIVVGGNNSHVWSTCQIPTSGKWYFEVKKTSANGAAGGYSMTQFREDPRMNHSHYSYTESNELVCFHYGNCEVKYENTDIIQGDDWGADNQNDVYSFAWDRDNHTCTIKRNNANGHTFTIDANLRPYPLSIGYSVTTTWAAGTWEYYFGGNGFNYDPPTGYTTLSTKNFPDSTIKDPTKYYGNILYTGNNYDGTRAITGLNFNPDLVWSKSRSQASAGVIYDSVRGFGADKELRPDNDAVEGAEDTAQYGYMTALDNGFNLVTGSAGAGNGNASLNVNSQTYVNWCWKESATAGFDIVSYTGNGSNRTISHSLGVKPAMMVVRHRGAAGNHWVHWHDDGMSGSNFVYWDTNGSLGSHGPIWNSTEPTSSVFSVGTDNQTNQNGINFIAYLWSQVEGFSKFGSYIGNNDSDGHYIFTGFRPALLWLRRIDSGDNWCIMDEKRSNSDAPQSFNPIWKHLRHDTSAAEISQDGQVEVDFFASGVKFRGSNGQVNGSGTYIYAAWAAAPFKYANAR